MPVKPSLRRLVPGLAALGGALALALALAFPAAASASLTQLLGPCDARAITQPFLPWLDPGSYVLAPDGSLEDGAAGWSLSGGAAVVPGNEPFQVAGAGDSRALALGTGSSATTPAMCVGLGYPTLRLFTTNTGALLSRLRVEVLYDDAAGRLRSLTVASILGGRWAPTPPILVLANIVSALPGGPSAIALRFTPQGLGGDWRIDDVFVDPYNSR